MSAPLLLDLTHTSHTRARTGIQRVARALWREFDGKVQPITHDPHLGAWRALETWELKNLSADSFSSKRGAAWPLMAKLRGRGRRVFSPSRAPLATGHPAAGLFVPEIFSPAVAAALPAIFAAAKGPRAALFHDAIALKFPELTPTKTVGRFPAYLRELLAFDGIAANSEDSRDTLLAYWRWLGVPTSAQPIVTTIALGTDLRPASSPHPASEMPASLRTVLCVGSLEGRKNHLSLLAACEMLWTQGARFDLRLIGLVHPQTGRAALEKIRALQAAGRPLRYDGPVTDAALVAAYADCAFTVYPSLIEGFGLPVLESLAHGKPCVCSARGALGEAAKGGGCVALDAVDAPHLAAAINRLLTAPNDLPVLSAAARARPFRSWSDYRRELDAWLPTLPRRV